MSRSTSSKPSGRSKSEKRTQETQGEAGVDVDVSPDEVSVDVGALEVSIDTEGEASIGIEIPTPVPGVTALGGIVVDTKTGEIIEVSGGIELGQVTGLEVAISGCNIVTTFYVEIPGTNIRFSYSVEGELPNCKIEEEEEEGEGEGEDTTAPEMPPLPDIPDDEIVIVGHESVDYRYSYAAASPGLPEYKQFIKKVTRIDVCQIPGVTYYTHWKNDNIPSLGYFEVIMSSNYREYFNNGLNALFTDTQSRLEQTIVGITLKERCDVAIIKGHMGGLMSSFSYGRWGDLKRKYYTDSQRMIDRVNNSFTRDFSFFTPVVLYTFDKRKQTSPPTPPQKMDKCCRESLILLEEIHKSLGCEELLDKKSKTGGFEVPRRLLAPGGKGEIKHHNYLEIFESVIRVQDNLGFHPFQVNIKDTNAAAAGDQSVNLKFVSLSAALEKILYLLIDTEDDGDAHTNMLVRLAFTCVNILTTLATTSRDVETIRDGLGIGIKAKREFIDTAFDVTCGQNEQGGFDKKKKEEIDKNMEESTEAMLPYLLRIKRHAIKTTEFDDKDDIKDLLVKILYSLKGNS